MGGNLAIAPFKVSVQEFGCYIWYARSRGAALAEAFRSWTSMRDEGTFKDFLRIARAWKVIGNGAFGTPITVGGEPAFFVTTNRQYVQFVRADSDVIHNSHPYDVEPPEMRPTSYGGQQVPYP